MEEQQCEAFQREQKLRDREREVSILSQRIKGPEQTPLSPESNDGRPQSVSRHLDGSFRPSSRRLQTSHGNMTSSGKNDRRLSRQLFNGGGDRDSLALCFDNDEDFNSIIEEYNNTISDLEAQVKVAFGSLNALQNQNKIQENKLKHNDQAFNAHLAPQELISCGLSWSRLSAISSQKTIIDVILSYLWASLLNRHEMRSVFYGRNKLNASRLLMLRNFLRSSEESLPKGLKNLILNTELLRMSWRLQLRADITLEFEQRLSKELELARETQNSGESGLQDHRSSIDA